MKRTVTLDPGHGGNDPGALGPNGTRESDAALDVCRRVRSMLEPHVRVVMTRDDDRFVTLSKRAEIANKARADVFVSYHFNSASSPNVPLSWEVYTSRGQNNSDRLATAIGEAHARRFPNQQQRFDWSDGDLDKEANFAVIRKANCPAVLMEGEFIHTKHGEKLIRSEGARQRMAEAVAEGVLKFLGLDQQAEQDDTGVIKLLTIEQRVERLEKLHGITTGIE